MTNSETIELRTVALCGTCDERIRSKGYTVPKCRRYVEGIPKEIITRAKPCPHFSKQTTL